MADEILWRAKISPLVPAGALSAAQRRVTAADVGLPGAASISVDPGKALDDLLLFSTGAAQDVALFYDIGRELAFGRDWPEWNAGSEFRAVRESSAAVRR